MTTQPLPKDQALALDDPPDYDLIVTEDDEPVDSIFSAKQQRLLVEVLYSTWKGGATGRSFVADANVGVFAAWRELPLVPDVFLSLDVQLPENLLLKQHRSYFVWNYGKPPDVVVEVVSDRKSKELGSRTLGYARMGVTYYVVFDPENLLQTGSLHLYRLREGAYEALTTHWLPDIGLGFTLWTGRYEGASSTWLRWCDRAGQVIPTAAELIATK